MNNTLLTTIGAIIATSAVALVRYFIENSLNYIELAAFFVFFWLVFYFSNKYFGKKCRIYQN